MKITVEAATETWLTSQADPGDEWSRDSTAGRVTDVTARENPTASDYSSSDEWNGELDVAVGGTVYAVVADYESGDTFGRSGGYAQVVDVFTDSAEADALLAAARAYSEDKKIQSGLEHNGKTYYASWTGYFESLNSLDIWSVRVQPKDGRPKRGPGRYKQGSY